MTENLIVEDLRRVVTLTAGQRFPRSNKIFTCHSLVTTRTVRAYRCTFNKFMAIAGAADTVFPRPRAITQLHRPL